MRNRKKRTVTARYAVNKLRKHYDAGTAEDAEAYLRKTGHVYVAGTEYRISDGEREKLFLGRDNYRATRKRRKKSRKD